MVNITKVKLQINSDEPVKEIVHIKVELGESVAAFIAALIKDWNKDCTCPNCQRGDAQHFWASMIMQTISELPAPETEDKFKGNTSVLSKVKH